MKSCRCGGSSSASARPRSSSVWARITRSTIFRRSPRNMCSVRHRPIPLAPRMRARSRVLWGVGVGPDAQPPSFVRALHQPLDGTDDLTFDLGETFGFVALQCSDDCARDDRHLAEEHLAGPAVDGDDVALADPGAVVGRELTRRVVDPQAPRRRRRRCGPCRGPPRRRDWSCHRARSGCPWRRPFRAGHRDWSPGAPG